MESFKDELIKLLKNYVQQDIPFRIVFYLDSDEATVCNYPIDKLFIGDDFIRIMRSDGFNISRLENVICVDVEKVRQVKAPTISEMLRRD